MSLIKKSGLRQPQAHITRRDFLKLAAAATALAACGRVAGQSEIVMTAPVAAASSTQTVAAPQAQHWLAANRLMFGPTPGDIDHIAAIGLDAFIEEQLAHDKQNPAEAEKRIDAITGLRDTLTARPGQLTDDKRQEIYQDIAQATLLRAVYNPAQLYELMVDFWSNHFNILFQKNTGEYLKTSDDRDVIRPNALGKFRDLLGASAHSPAMLVYLDNQSNRKGKPNENYARELMELHTLGVDGGYRQKDVTELARILTGWSIQPPNRFSNVEAQSAPGNTESMPGFWFNERVHDQGDKEWLGHRVHAQGQKEGEFALDALAKHPSTAKHLAFKLAQYFVHDQPSPALVAKLAQVFLDHDGAIVPVLSSLFVHEAFWAKENIGAKFKTPYQYVLSAVRALGVTPANLQVLSGAMATQGMPLYGCPTPDGYRNTEAAWLNPDGMTKRINFATMLASGRMGINVPTETLISHLGPLVSEPTKILAREAAQDPALASALVLAGPSMMRR